MKNKKNMAQILMFVYTLMIVLSIDVYKPSISLFRQFLNISYTYII
jgi:hypothetical protein